MIAGAPQPDPGYPHERVSPDTIARLMSADSQKMTEKANVSPMHVIRERRFRLARAANPSLDDGQVGHEIKFVGAPEAPTWIIDIQTDLHNPATEPWQTWGSTLRYLVYRLAQATPTVLLLWETCIRH